MTTGPTAERAPERQEGRSTEEVQWQVLFAALIFLASIVTLAARSLDDVHQHVLDLVNTDFVFGVAAAFVYLRLRHAGNGKQWRWRFVRTAPWMVVAMLGPTVVAFHVWPLWDQGFWVTGVICVAVTAAFVVIGIQPTLAARAMWVFTFLYASGIVGFLVAVANRPFGDQVPGGAELLLYEMEAAASVLFVLWYVADDYAEFTHSGLSLRRLLFAGLWIVPNIMSAPVWMGLVAFYPAPWWLWIFVAFAVAMEAMVASLIVATFRRRRRAPTAPRTSHEEAR